MEDYGMLSIPCERCGAGIGEPCDDVRDGEEAFGCIAHCHNSKCGVVYDSRGSGLWLLTENGDWVNHRTIALETAVAVYPHLWERYAGTYGDRYRTWYRGRWLGIFQRFSFSEWPCPFVRSRRSAVLITEQHIFVGLLLQTDYAEIGEGEEAQLSLF